MNHDSRADLHERIRALTQAETTVENATKTIQCASRALLGSVQLSLDDALKRVRVCKSTGIPIAKDANCSAAIEESASLLDRQHKRLGDALASIRSLSP